MDTTPTITISPIQRKEPTFAQFLDCKLAEQHSDSKDYETTDTALHNRCMQLRKARNKDLQCPEAEYQNLRLKMVDDQINSVRKLICGSKLPAKTMRDAMATWRAAAPYDPAFFVEQKFDKRIAKLITVLQSIIQRIDTDIDHLRTP